LPEMALPLAAIQPRAFVLRDVVPYGLQGCSPHHVVVRASSPSHVDVHGRTHFATRPRADSRCRPVPFGSDCVATKFGSSPLIAQLLYDPRSLLRSCSPRAALDAAP